MKVRICTIAVVIGLSTFVMLTHFNRTNADLHSARSAALALINGVGGVDAVCKQADSAFAWLNNTNVDLICGDELTNFPAIAGMGISSCLLVQTRPAFLSIHVGKHFDGYYIKIVNTNDYVKHVQEQHELEIVPGRVYVHR